MSGAGQRAEALAAGVIAPLVLGGDTALQRPFGPRLALELSRQRAVVDRDLAARIDGARLRRARSVAPVDVLPPLSEAEWALAAALNDLLQVSNHKLSSIVTRGRHGELLDKVVELCAYVPPPATLEEALARHATFAQLLDVVRVDTTVATWAESIAYRGASVQRDDFVWAGLRRVQVTPTQVPLRHMGHGVPVDEQAFHQAIRALLHGTPLTDLATAGREHPSFSWSVGSLSLVSARGGAQLAINAIQTMGQYERALAAVQPSQELGGAAQAAVARFVRGLEQAIAIWTTAA